MTMTTKLGLLSLFCLSALLIHSHPDLTWHLPLVGTPVPQLSQTSPSLRFFRHADPHVKLVGRLPSVIVTATKENTLSAINPKNGSILWRFLSPDSAPIVQYAMDLDHQHVAVISGQGSLAIRLLTLSDGRVLWENHLGDAGHVNISGIPHGTDLLFVTDQHSEHSTFPDVIASRGAEVLRIHGHDGKTRWRWTPSSSEIILRVFAQTLPDRLDVLLSHRDFEGSPRTQVQSIFSTTGQTRDHRPLSSQRCHQTDNSPLILFAPTDDTSSSTKSVVVCVDNDGYISSALVPENPSEPLKIFSFADLKAKHPILQDVGLARHGVFVAKLPDGAANVLRVGHDGALKSFWSFDASDLQPTFAGSIDRDGLPYVSKISFVSNLGLASLEILSLTPTEYTPEGMVVGQTFGYDLSENGRIVGIAVEVLQITNYVPASRVLLVTDLGAMQLWQGEILQWERHEDLASPASVTLHHSKRISGPPPKIQWSELLNTAAQMIQDGFARFLDLKAFRSDVSSETLPHAHVWVVGTSTGRIFAIVKEGDSTGRILWKRNLTPLGPLISQTDIKWEDVMIESGQNSPNPKVVVSINQDELMSRTFEIDLTNGKVIKKSLLEHLRSNKASNTDTNKQLLAVHDQDVGGSPARFLGDRGALFKYLNPNLAVYLNEGFGRQTIEILDQPTGSLIWAFEFQAPVETSSILAALTENWLVIASRELSHGFTQIHSIEWFMSSKADTRVDGSVANLTSSVRAYLTPFRIKNASFTKSRLGVTSRALLVINDMDQIVGFPRQLLDSRRPFRKPTQVEMEERLMKYDPMLTPDPKMIITGDRPTAKLKHVFSFPTEFESTSAVIGVGLDLFSTSTAPSGRFDMLGDDFNKIQLILTSVGLLAATLLLRPMVQAKKLRQQWYA
ncbi:hypothetical protein O181_053611 [Austropuccinia psidii MF-1]|uniref:ER membrane protein complex subunit 1 n=1 Tax=Austropuccinia psidii MF-1 TaxID=1389203 RepID=A0A9Q3HQC9_9BASI|nr:hypothetical protein [Austropuccinia psidii MF-1]